MHQFYKPGLSQKGELHQEVVVVVGDRDSCGKKPIFRSSLRPECNSKRQVADDIQRQVFEVIAHVHKL